MARWPPPDAAHPFGHDAIALSFFVACVAATVVLASSMCLACGRKPKSRSQSPSTSSNSGTEASSEAHVDSQRLQDEHGHKKPDDEKTVIEVSPDVATHGPIPAVALPTSTSKRRLSMNLSMNIPDKMRLSRRERKEKVESEETLWKKAIILGEKCRVPGEGDGGPGDADEVAGSFRLSSYSRSMSRTYSFANHHDTVHTTTGAHPLQAREI